VIVTPPRWTARPDTGGLVLVPPGGPSHGTIRYRERDRPLRPVRELLAAPPGFLESRRGAIERLVTSEGEHAALVVCEGTVEGRPAERTSGFVFLDDSYASIVAETTAPASFATFRDVARALTIGDVHVLGARRRRYRYTPPPGFQPLAGLFDTTWYPLDYPRRAISMTVAPALPQHAGLAGSLVEAVLGARPGAAVASPRPISGRGGLTGQLVPIPGADGSATCLAILEDAAYAYPLRLDVGAAAQRDDIARFEALVLSVEPVPAARIRRDDREMAAAVGHWAT
jgi:hypothetical protein